MAHDIEAARKALIQARAWVDHWSADIACGLTPTTGSLEMAKAMITDALSAIEASHD